jgi:hypothetical protein
MRIKVVLGLGRRVNRVVVLQLSAFLCNITNSGWSNSTGFPTNVKVAAFGFLKLKGYLKYGNLTQSSLT